MRLPEGFLAAGVCAGLKKNEALDLALVVNQGPDFHAAAVFTSNKVVAAPVEWSRQVIADGILKAVLLNSGGANACTGPDGFADTHRSAEFLAELLDISSSDIAICSTGLIGVRLPMDRLIPGIKNATSQLLSDGDRAAQAIMTTDSHPKTHLASGDGINFFGMAKGAGMLAPSLATMLSVICTDAVVNPAWFKRVVADIVDRTFNSIDSDGCMSTNDTVIVMSSGASGKEISEEVFYDRLLEVAENLSQQLIDDAEGATKVLKISTVNAASSGDAREVGRACARNNLLKCALYGEDPNWGRILAAVGTANATIDPYLIDVYLNDVQVCRNGARLGQDPIVDLTPRLIDIRIDLHQGEHDFIVWSNDLSVMYVHENSAYSS
jgi:glutamate N-acetyltransferase / amino-acid N-acetyltransferase